MCSWALPSVHVIRCQGLEKQFLHAHHVTHHITHVEWCWMMLNDVDTLSTRQFWYRLMILHHFANCGPSFNWFQLSRPANGNVHWPCFLPGTWHSVVDFFGHLWSREIMLRRDVQKECQGLTLDSEHGESCRSPDGDGALTGRQWNFGMRQWLVRRPSLEVCQSVTKSVSRLQTLLTNFVFFFWHIQSRRKTGNTQWCSSKAGWLFSCRFATVSPLFIIISTSQNQPFQLPQIFRLTKGQGLAILSYGPFRATGRPRFGRWSKNRKQKRNKNVIRLRRL